jgi:hypothetical protein
VIAGDYYPENGYVLEVRNNLCFHTVATSSDPIIKKNTVHAIRDTGNNIYCSDPIWTRPAQQSIRQASFHSLKQILMVYHVPPVAHRISVPGSFRV